MTNKLYAAFVDNKTMKLGKTEKLIKREIQEKQR